MISFSKLQEIILLNSPARKDILCIFAGLRPLAADNENTGSTKEVSRRHKITFSSSGLLSIVGGKWTTYRRMAEETIDKAIKKGFLEKRKCITRDLRLSAPADTDASDRLSIYGEGSEEIKKMIAENPDLGEIPSSGTSLHKCGNNMDLQERNAFSHRRCSGKKDPFTVP